MPELIREQQSLTAASESVWVPVSQSDNEIITSMRRTRAISLSRQLAVSSPLYNRLLSAIMDFVIPGDTQLVIDNVSDAIKDTLDHFWYEGPSALSKNARDLIFTLLVDGEIVIKKRVNKADGKVTLTNVTADNISKVQRGEGFNAINQIELRDPSLESEDPELLKVIKRSPTGPLRGDIFYFRVFPAGYSHGIRGLPLITHTLDEIAAHSELIYTRLARLGELSSYYWDVTMEGATQDQVNEFLQSPRSVPPEAGETFAHNERVVWKLIAAEFESIGEEVDTMTGLLTGAVGLTQEFVGRAPARDITTESLFASIAHLTAIREMVFSMLTTMIQYQMEMAAKYNGAVQEVPKFRIMAKEIGSRSLQRSAQAFARYADGLQKAVQQGLISDAEASNVLKLLLTQLGLITDLNMDEVTPGRYIDQAAQEESSQGYYDVKLY